MYHAKQYFAVKPYDYTDMAFGFLPADAEEDVVDIQSANRIYADDTLRNQQIVIRLDRLHIQAYPRTGVHHILFSFYARNTVKGNQEEHLHYNVTVQGQVELPYMRSGQYICSTYQRISYANST